MSAEAAGLHFRLPQRIFHERATLRTATVLNLDNVLHVAADLFERFVNLLGREFLAQQPIEPRQVDVDYRHSGASCSASRLVPYRSRMSDRPNLSMASRSMPKPH